MSEMQRSSLIALALTLVSGAIVVFFVSGFIYFL